MEGQRGLSVRIIAFGVFSAICYFGATVIITLLLAVLLAFLLDPFVEALRRWRIPRPIAIGISMIIAALIVGGLIALFLDRAQEFSQNVPQYSKKIQKVSNDIRRRIMALQKKSEDIGKTIIPASGEEPKPLVIQQYSTWRDLFFRNLGPFYDYLIIASFFPFLVYFLLREKGQIRFFVSSMVSSRTQLSNTFIQGTSDRIVTDLSAKIRGFVVGYLLSTAILFAASFLIFLAFGVDEAFIWSVIFSVLNVLPFVGAILSVIPPALIAIIQFSSVKVGISFVLICLGLHLFYANWLIPRLMGKRTDLSPLVVLIAMMYWGFLWGAVGIFLAIPITASLRSIWIQYSAIQNANRLAAEME